MRQPFSFVPAKQNALVITLGEWCLPFVLKALHVCKVEFRPETLDVLQSISNDRVLICPNHPTNTEPAVVFGLAKGVRQRFHYLCCREAFSYWGGAYGWLIQRFGAYSIVRGALDRSSFQYTRKVLSQPNAKVVIFPEGEVYSQNDTLLPFQNGVIQQGFWAMEEAKKQDDSAEVLILPLAIHYRFISDMRKPIERSLGHLESALGIASSSSTHYVERLKAIGASILERLERTYGVEHGESWSVQERMDAIKRAILRQAAQAVGIDVGEGSLVEAMRRVINAAHQVTLEQPATQSRYDVQLWEQQRAHIQPVLMDLERLANWIAVYDGYVAEDPTQERIVQTLWRLEKEVFGRVYCTGPMECRVGNGDLVNLQDFWDGYRTSKRQVVDEVTQLVEARVQQALEVLSSGTRVARRYEKLDWGA